MHKLLTSIVRLKIFGSLHELFQSLKVSCHQISILILTICVLVLPSNQCSSKLNNEHTIHDLLSVSPT